VKNRFLSAFRRIWQKWGRLRNQKASKSVMSRRLTVCTRNQPWYVTVLYGWLFVYLAEMFTIINIFLIYTNTSPIITLLIFIVGFFHYYFIYERWILLCNSGFKNYNFTIVTFHYRNVCWYFQMETVWNGPSMCGAKTWTSSASMRRCVLTSANLENIFLAWMAPWWVLCCIYSLALQNLFVIWLIHAFSYIILSGGK